MKLVYFNGKGLAEVTRLILTSGGVPFEEQRFGLTMEGGKVQRPEFDAAKAAGELPLGQVPLLICDDGTKLFQSKAIARYAAAKAGQLGSTPEQAGLIDAICESVVELTTASGNAKDDEAKKAFLEGKLPTVLAGLEKIVGDGFSIGGKLSQADIFLYHLATHALSPTPWGPGNPAAAALIQASPKIGVIIKAVAALPAIVAWEAGRPARGEPF